MYEIVFYRDVEGCSPVEDFIEELDKKAIGSKKERVLLRKVIYQINILERLGTRAGKDFTKYIGNKIWELRPGNRRILFFIWIENKIVLLHTFHKKSSKTPKKEIERAKREMSDWLSRNENN